MCADIFTDKHSGKRFLNKMDNETGVYMAQHGIFEYPLINWCKEFAKPGKAFIDIGAHIGTYSIILGEHFDTVYSFEAQRDTYMCLCGSIILNDSGKNIKPFNYAIGDSDNVEMTLHHVSPDGGGSTLNSEIAVNERSTNGNYTDQETIICRTLDSFELEDIGFIKIDVEGHEEKVLRGAISTLERCGWPPIIFECWSEHEKPWFKESKESLFNLLTDDLKYNVNPINGYNNMFLATK